MIAPGRLMGGGEGRGWLHRATSLRPEPCAGVGLRGRGKMEADGEG